MSQYLIIPNKDNIEQSLALSKEYGLGFEFNDFFWPKVLGDDAKKEEIAAFYDTKEMPSILTSHGAFFDVLVFSEDPLIAETSELRVRQSMDIAKRVKAGAVIFHTNYEPLLTQDYYRNSWRDRTAKFFRKICEEYPTIQVYMENMFDTDPYELKSIAELMREVPNFGVCLDYAHATIFGKNIDYWVKDLAPYIRHVHINDNDGVTDLHLAVGDGMTDWEKFLEHKKLYFPNATILVETTPIDRQIKSLEYMKEHGFFD